MRGVLDGGFSPVTWVQPRWNPVSVLRPSNCASVSEICHYIEHLKGHAVLHTNRELPLWQDPQDNPVPARAGWRAGGGHQCLVTCLPDPHLAGVATWPRNSRGAGNGFGGQTPAASQLDISSLGPAFSGT